MVKKVDGSKHCGYRDGALGRAGAGSQKCVLMMLKQASWVKYPWKQGLRERMAEQSFWDQSLHDKVRVHGSTNQLQKTNQMEGKGR